MLALVFFFALARCFAFSLARPLSGGARRKRRSAKIPQEIQGDAAIYRGRERENRERRRGTFSPPPIQNKCFFSVEVSRPGRARKKKTLSPWLVRVESLPLFTILSFLIATSCGARFLHARATLFLSLSSQRHALEKHELARVERERERERQREKRKRERGEQAISFAVVAAKSIASSFFLLSSRPLSLPPSLFRPRPFFPRA